MNRRALLAAVASLGTSGLAGCTGPGSGSGADAGSGSRSGSGSPTPSASDEPTPTPTTPASSPAPPAFDTPATGTCEPVDLPRPEQFRDGPDPLPYPDLPGDLRPDTAGAFAVAFERASVTNVVIADVDRGVGPGDPFPADVSLEPVDGSPVVRRAGEGFLVRVDLAGSLAYDVVTPSPAPSNATATRTPTPVPSVPIRSSADYYVTARFAVRNGIENSAGVPTEEAVVVCST